MPKPNWEEVRDADGKLLFEIDAERKLIRVVRRRRQTIVDLTEYLKGREREAGNDKP